MLHVLYKISVIRIILCPGNSKLGMLGISQQITYSISHSLMPQPSRRGLMHTGGFDAIETSNLHVYVVPMLAGLDLQRAAIGVYPEGENNCMHIGTCNYR